MTFETHNREDRIKHIKAGRAGGRKRKTKENGMRYKIEWFTSERPNRNIVTKEVIANNREDALKKAINSSVKLKNAKSGYIEIYLWAEGWIHVGSIDATHTWNFK